MKCTLRIRLAILVALLAVPHFATAQADQAQSDQPSAEQPQTVASSAQSQTVAQDQQPQSAAQQQQQAAIADAAPPSADAPPEATADQPESSSAQANNSVDTPANADEAVDHHILSTFFHDEYHIWTGPFHASNYDSHTMKKYGIPFILISGAAITTDRYTAKWLPNTKSQVIWSGRVSQIGAPYTLAGFTAGYYLFGKISHNDHAKETGFLALEALAHSGIMVEVLKEITQRTRPADVTHGTGWWDGGSSFPSGHAISSFAVASVFAYEYHDHIVVPIAAYSVATLVALSRMGAREHWVSDLFVGSTMGFMIGRYVYKQHHDPDLPGSLPVRRSVTARLRPAFGIGDAGPGLYWNF